MVETIENGVLLTGGGACSAELTTGIQKAVDLPFHFAPDPLHAVIRGAQNVLAHGERSGLWVE